MPKVSINLLRWNSSWHEVRVCIEAVLASDSNEYELVYTENADAGAPTLLAFVHGEYGKDPRIKMVNNGQNRGYAGGHNRFFSDASSELVMVLNPDAILDRSFLKHILEAFDDPTVGAATGKMVKPMVDEGGTSTLDGTGIVLARSRRGRERGQLEVDTGQYDNMKTVFGVSGTASVYRRSALESIRLGKDEYFDTDFFAYWEDLDLSWRLRLRDYQCVYVPTAIVQHKRAVGSSPGGLRNLSRYIHHHRSFALKIRQWSWRNHIFAILKNDFGWGFYRDLPRIVIRELALLGFIVVFSPSTLLAIPDFVRLLPRMLRKRRIIQSRRVVRAVDISRLFD